MEALSDVCGVEAPVSGVRGCLDSASLRSRFTSKTPPSLHCNGTSTHLQARLTSIQRESFPRYGECLSAFVETAQCVCVSSVVGGVVFVDETRAMPAGFSGSLDPAMGQCDLRAEVCWRR